MLFYSCHHERSEESVLAPASTTSSRQVRARNDNFKNRWGNARFTSVVPTGLGSLPSLHPALKRWANLYCAYGADSSCWSSNQFSTRMVETRHSQFETGNLKLKTSSTDNCQPTTDNCPYVAASYLLGRGVISDVSTASNSKRGSSASAAKYALVVFNQFASSRSGKSGL